MAPSAASSGQPPIAASDSWQPSSGGRAADRKRWLGGSPPWSGQVRRVTGASTCPCDSGVIAQAWSLIRERLAEPNYARNSTRLLSSVPDASGMRARNYSLCGSCRGCATIPSGWSAIRKFIQKRSSRTSVATSPKRTSGQSCCYQIPTTGPFRARSRSVAVLRRWLELLRRLPPMQPPHIHLYQECREGIHVPAIYRSSPVSPIRGT